MSILTRAAGAQVRERAVELAEALVEDEFLRRPELAQRYGAAGREKCLQDAGYHLAYLAEALAFDNSALFTDYVAWAKVVLLRRGVPASDLSGQLERLAAMLCERFGGEGGEIAAGFVRSAVATMPAMPVELPTHLTDGTPLGLLAHQYAMALLRGDRFLASRLVSEAVGRGTPVNDIYLQVFQPTQYEIGRLWQSDEISVAQEHYCTAATQAVMSQLYPHLFSGRDTGRLLVATCVSGDLHELGARMVADLFEMAGWNTYYTGASTPHGAIVGALVERQADMLAVSATMPFYLSAVRELIAVVRANPGCAGLPIMVGGRAFAGAPDLWREVGADGTASDAQEAVAVAERLILTRQAGAGASPA